MALPMLRSATSPEASLAVHASYPILWGCHISLLRLMCFSESVMRSWFVMRESCSHALQLHARPGWPPKRISREPGPSVSCGLSYWLIAHQLLCVHMVHLGGTDHSTHIVVHKETLSCSCKGIGIYLSCFPGRYLHIKAGTECLWVGVTGRDR